MIRRATGALALLSIAVGPVAAQGPTFGVLGGITSSKVAISGEGVTVTLDSRTGFAVGGSMQFPLSTMLDLEIDALYAQKGTKVSDGGDSAELKLTYVEVPVLFRYGIGTGSTRPFLLAGGSIAMEAGCDVGATTGGVSTSTECADVFGDEQKSTDIGLHVGGGVQFDRFSVQVRYSVGMTDIIDDEDDEISSKNRALFLLAGFSF